MNEASTPYGLLPVMLAWSTCSKGYIRRATSPTSKPGRRMGAEDPPYAEDLFP